MAIKKEVVALRKINAEQDTGLTEPGSYPFTLIIGSRLGEKPQAQKADDNRLHVIEMNPDDAATQGLVDGRKVMVSNQTGNLLAVVRRSGRLARGNLFLQLPPDSPIWNHLMAEQDTESPSTDTPTEKKVFHYTSARVDILPDTFNQED